MNDDYIDRLRSENKSLKEDIADLNLALECVKKNNLSRKTQLEERDRQIEQNINTFAKELRSALDLIKDRDRTIASLEENLERAESNHLEQLRAIAQMLEPIKEDEYHFGNIYTAGALRLVVTVVQNNINRLDPTGF
jgi:small-conductance mechanosensitive channel